MTNERQHPATGEKPAERPQREGLLPVELTRPWTGVKAPSVPHAPRVTFRLAPPVVKERPLSLYEEVTV